MQHPLVPKDRNLRRPALVKYGETAIKAGPSDWLSASYAKSSMRSRRFYNEAFAMTGGPA